MAWVGGNRFMVLTSTYAARASSSPHPAMGFKQFVALIAALMAINSLAIDAMLPALKTIGDAIGIVADNQRQWIVTIYLLAFGVAQIGCGPLADRFGRKPVLLIGLGMFALFSVVAALARSFETMMIARALEGVGAASSRVLSVSIVRDCYSGRPMARVMSLAFIVFMVVPVIAPSIGQVIILFTAWPSIFIAFAVFALAVMAWVWFRLPETLNPENRVPISVAAIAHSFKIVLTTRIAVGYTLATAVLMGGLFGFVNSAQQVFIDAFHAGRLFTPVFAIIASFIAISSLLNARLVGRLGMHLLSHGAMIAYIVCAVVHAAIALGGRETLPIFTIMLGIQMFCFGLVASNFGALAMDPLGRLAGAASSVQGFVTTVGGALCGFWVGQSFNGTAVPLTLGYAGFGVGAFAIVLVTEKFRLFVSSEPGKAGAAQTAS
jgi:DHA1 family bicyclomycin/chloramphenicol resistance-like MFS transporter